MFKVPENFRIKSGPFATTQADGCNGAFEFHDSNIWYRCIVSDGGGWEHVSVSLSVKRTPEWEEMCMIKNLFWDDTDCVMQLHPPKEDYVNHHKYCLHLWRPVGQEIPRPPSVFVGPKP